MALKQIIAQRTFLAHDDPRAPADGQGFMDLTAIDDAGNAWHRFYNGSSWSDWEALGQPTP